MCGTADCKGKGKNCHFEPYILTVSKGINSREKKLEVCQGAGRRIKGSLFSTVGELVSSSEALGMTVSLVKA